MDKKNALDILGLGRKADLQQAKTAFREKAKHCHPDRFVGDEDAVRRAEDQMKTINSAFKFLEPILEDIDARDLPLKANEAADKADAEKNEPYAEQTAGLNDANGLFKRIRGVFKKQRGDRRYRSIRPQKRAGRMKNHSACNAKGHRARTVTFESILNGVTPDINIGKSKGKRTGKSKPASTFTSYENYHRHMAVKRRITAARIPAVETGIGRVEKISPVRRVNGIGEE